MNAARKSLNINDKQSKSKSKGILDYNSGTQSNNETSEGMQQTQPTNSHNSQSQIAQLQA